MDEEPGTDQSADQIGEQPGPNLTDNEQPIQTVPDLATPTPEPSPAPETPPVASPAPVVSSDAPPSVGPDTPPTTAGFEPPAITPSDQASPDQTPPPQSVSPVNSQSSFPSSDEAPKGFNWGAFWLTWVWGLGHRVWGSIILIPIGIVIVFYEVSLSLFSSLSNGLTSMFGQPTTQSGHIWPYYLGLNVFTLLIRLWFGFKGNSWAWKRRGSNGLEEFKKVEKEWSIFAWILGVLFILTWILGTIGVVKESQTKATESPSITSSSSEITPSVSSTTETPLGTTVQSGNFTVNVVSVNPKPTITGDAPDSGTEYLEIFVTVANSGKEKDSISAGEFYYQTAAGKELKTADTMGTDSPNKNINLTGGDERLSVEFLDPGATAANKALIFQIPTGDSGKLIWHEKMFDNSSAKLGIFLLK